MRERLTRGTGYGYGHAKMDLVEEHERVFGQKRELYEHYCSNSDEVRKLMERGYESAYAIANSVCDRARAALGLKSFLSSDCNRG